MCVGVDGAQLWQPYAAYITLVCLTGRERKELEKDWEIQWEGERRANSHWKCWIETLQGFFHSINSAQLSLSDLPFSSMGFCLYYGGGCVSWSKKDTHTHPGGFTLLAIAQRFDASLSPVRRHAVLLPQGTLIYRHANLGQNVSSWKGQICIEKEGSRGRQDQKGIERRLSLITFTDSSRVIFFPKQQ